MKVMAVMAHPDDEAFAISGTIKRLSQAGHEVFLVETTDGNGATIHPDSLNTLKKKGSIKEMRREELWKSAGILEIKTIYFLDYKDGELNNSLVYGDELVDKIKKIIKKEKPEVVLCYDNTGISWHVDHIVTSLVTARASLEESKTVDKLFLFTANPVYKPRLPFITNVKIKPDYYVDIKDFSGYKIKSIKSHKSQRHDWERFLGGNTEDVMDRERFFLKMDNKRNEEIFKIFRKI